LICSVSLVT